MLEQEESSGIRLLSFFSAASAHWSNSSIEPKDSHIRQLDGRPASQSSRSMHTKDFSFRVLHGVRVGAFFCARGFVCRRTRKKVQDARCQWSNCNSSSRQTLTKHARDDPSVTRVLYTKVIQWSNTV